MSDLEAEGIPPIEEQPPGIEGQNEVEGMIPPGDRPKAVEDWGTTSREERLDEPLAERVLREQPERESGGAGAGQPVGRLVQPDGGMVDLDREPTEVAMETEDDGGLSAEEAAMHITDSP
jgi:hypothetical protein